jgi:putative oxidoreductase
MSGTSIDSQRRADAVTITALRAMVGIIMAVHGAMKLMDIPGTAEGFAHLNIPYPQYAAYLAIAGEFFGGIGLAVGLLTRVAALGTLCSMAVAIGYVHIGHGLLAKNGGWEYPAVLALVALFFVTHGAGPASLDAFFARKYEARRGSARRYRERRVSSYA